jgi:hypothetical protein
MDDTARARELERRLDRLEAQANAAHREHGRIRQELAGIDEFLDMAPRVQQLLEDLSSALFGEILDEIEANLTAAIREILGQERLVTSTREISRGRLAITFQIENQGNVEDILTGQGGSVCNILSVGLRLIALSQLDPANHRPFLVLDEQDCWLRPDLVPRFMQLIRRIAKRLGLQVLIISHHPVDLFATKAHRILGLLPDRDKGVRVELLREDAGEVDFDENEAARDLDDTGPDA